MRIIGRFFKIVFYAVGIGIIIFTVPQLYHKYSDYLQKERIVTKVQQATNQVSNQEAPENWQTLNNWWLVNQNGTLIYNAENLTVQDQAAAKQAADWWNQLAGRTLITVQTNQGTQADVYLAYVDNKYLGFSGLTGTNHLLLINQAIFSENESSNDVTNILIHELGHALGLAHAPQDYNDVMSPKQVATGELKTASNYDRAALKASFTRMNSALHQNMSQASYMQVAAQTPYPDLNRIDDMTYNAKDGIAATLQSTLAKVKNKTGLTAAQQTALTDSKASLKKIENDDGATDKEILAAQTNLQRLIEAFNLQSYFPQAYPDQQINGESEKINNFLQKIQDTF
ncbi:matrixin family metalloprotease [Agrilactobacillus yilanensis]|uniref:Matrixin family metalloprotease n=1 Tax=Agrilactobacillus yilanensis TaxID=2485997 RepID=A0ABW4J894_9LACO|nr:matrixin family metalloprotease [Agrilactobacillus yilanensis]